MRKITFGLALTIAVLSTVATSAERQMRIGNFLVSIEKDRFGDGSKAIAMVVASSYVLAARCLEGELSIAIGTVRKRWDAGDTFDLKVSVDLGKPIDMSGSAVNDTTIQIVDSEALVRSLSGAKEAAFRISDTNGSFDMVFPLRQSTKAIDEIQKACKT